MKKRRLLAAILVCALCAVHAGCSDMIADQGGAAVVAGGGAGGNAGEIYTAEDLDAVRNNLSGSYFLMADIDLSGYTADGGWVPIGDDTTPFTGTLEGNGHTISGLTINRSTSDYQGLFGCIGSGGTVRNCGLAGGSVTGNNYVGFLAGRSSGTVSGCYATGDVSGAFNVGGLVGDNYSGTVSGSFTTGDVSGPYNVGGLVGDNFGTVSGSFATGDVIGSGNNVGGLLGRNIGTVSGSFTTGDVSGVNHVGGLVGDQSNGCSLTNCYAKGKVSGTQWVGGLLGGSYGTISNCYVLGTVTGSGDYIGGLIGRLSTGSANSSYYYQEPDNSIGSQETEAVMRDSATYVGWDFTTIWGIDPSINGGFPYLLNNMP
ncbi:MAG: hypothetical protein JXA20_00505 [Spirochaetes bacterium]|nr:hypothetical protein [Spirochaetota bacterium]